jgi:hypothetical protein
MALGALVKMIEYGFGDQLRCFALRKMARGARLQAFVTPNG